MEQSSSFLRLSQLPVCNICPTETQPTTWNEILEKGIAAYHQCPFDLVLWYPNVALNRHKIVHVVSTFLFQWVPAYFIDIILLMIGYKPLYVISSFTIRYTFISKKSLQIFILMLSAWPTSNGKSLSVAPCSLILPIVLGDSSLIIS